ncbi:(Lyso)-N-acylphosphatidylethanolamine lipase isoform X2 [Chrysoperla carnea]|uniref:(Lyso)-N-acylphosphatidylethanolamine lipase isoform X2 n=1 Tax=Chrysoperla carnea TaxID=189513 RepID=UPI001D0762EB|nr:(Lyso)-N-acylphosphatidylethanolamine lipase isoform X2 [Chrysoperla carnea]
MADNSIPRKDIRESWFGKWFSWNKSSAAMLRQAEKKILSFCRSAYRGCYVDIGPVVGPNDKIWTIALNEQSDNTPLVLLHGLGAGVALWCMNLDAFASTRPVYAIDLLGFGRSSRPNFSTDGMEAEQQFVQSVEEWRREMKLDKIILLGHSMGGFLAASYAINHPDHTKHLILADPWGFPERPLDVERKSSVPLWVRAIAFAVQPLNPLWAVRFVGPFGQWIIEKTRPDLIKKFSPILQEEDNLITQYIYQCNSQSPTGESAFHAMMSGFGWAKHPMVKRIDKLREDIPITLIYGARSWVDNSAGEIIKSKRINSYVNIQVITGAGHHVYADRPEVFNKHVIDACNLFEERKLSTNAVDWMRTSTPDLKNSSSIDDTDSEVESDKPIKTTLPTENKTSNQTISSEKVPTSS